eukprot:CAMPEP_0178455394 /NCGR_PEP_ID=MMETSP0689_2-20121128/45885_1 /TAXON_ID=160604 /ORGANISM="Amphidinium massartii, Strain CS-259" /LENGTH=38 /DNA_ID= /DNA_START= /DNA_END= /DNA_ORIENTATION=
MRGRNANSAPHALAGLRTPHETGCHALRGVNGGVIGAE